MYLTQIEGFENEQIKACNAYKYLSTSADKPVAVFAVEEELKKYVSLVGHYLCLQDTA